MKFIIKESTINGKKTVVTAFSRSRLTKVGVPYYINRFKYLAKNYNLIILTTRPDFFEEIGIPSAKIVVLPYHENLPLILRGVLFCLTHAITLLFIRYDLLFLNTSNGVFSIFNFRRRPVIIDIDVEHEPIGTTKKNNLSKIFEKILTFLNHSAIKKADKVLPLDSQLPSIVNELNINPQKIESLLSGVDLKLFDPKNENYKEVVAIPKDRYILMQIGTIHEKRGLNFLLECTKEISTNIKNILLVQVGCEPEYIKKIKQISEEMDILDNVLPLPMVKHEMVPAYLQVADIGVNIMEANKYYERQTPQKIFEYFAMGLPVIANDLLSHRIYIENGLNGFIIKDEKEFKEVVMKLHNDKKLYESMSLNAREFAKEYDLDKINKRFGEIIDELLSKQ